MENNIIFGKPRFVIPENMTNKLCNKEPNKYPNRFGDCSYYKWRFEDFLKRHDTCKHIPPTYYFGPFQDKSTTPYIGDKIDQVEEWWSKVKNTEPLQPPYPKYKKGTPIVRESYGFKYCVVFSNYLMPKLSERGQKWLKLARYNLQDYMDQGVCGKNDFTSKYNNDFNKKVATRTLKEVELDDDWFQNFAFATHPDAYLDAGLLEISMADKLEVSLTPDFKEWASTGTWEQAWLVGREQIKKWKNDATDYGKEKYEELKSELEKRVQQGEQTAKELLDKIRSWF